MRALAVIPGRNGKVWYDIDLVFADNTLLIFIDGRRIATMRLPGVLPETGMFGVETHHELWIDQVTIAHYSEYSVD